MSRGRQPGHSHRQNSSHSAPNYHHSQENEQRECPVHGPYRAKMFFFGKKKIETGCPVCVQEAEARRTAPDPGHIEQLRSESGIRGRRWRAVSLDNYVPDCPAAAEALSKIRIYTDNYDVLGELGTNLLLCGEIGTGKTHMAIAIGNALLIRGVRVRYVSFPVVMEELKATWGDRNLTERSVLQPYQDADLLILDELGMHTMADKERSEVLLYRLIDERYGDLRPTIGISNFSTIDELKIRVGGRVLDRLLEGASGSVSFNWSSYRPNNKNPVRIKGGTKK